MLSSRRPIFRPCSFDNGGPSEPCGSRLGQLDPVAARATPALATCSKKLAQDELSMPGLWASKVSGAMSAEHPSEPPLACVERVDTWACMGTRGKCTVWHAPLRSLCRMAETPPRRPHAGMDPFFIELEFLDESFTSIINSIPLVETVPELAVAEASFLYVASSCGPPPPRPHSEGKQRRAQPPTRAGAAVTR